MAQDGSGNAPPRGLSSFANLLGSNAGTISSAPVIYGQQPSSDDADKDAPAAKKQQINSAALRFQPTKRPQIQSQKKTKPAFPKPAGSLQSSASPDPVAASNKPAAPSIVSLAANPPSKTTLADWTNDDDDVNGFYAATQHRQRGGRKKKKKKQQEEEVEQNWDDIYDPTRPNDYNQYKGSDEQLREIAEWKELLYRHRREQSREDLSSEEEDYGRSRMKPQFAPPKSYNFAPPPDLNTPTPPAPPASSAPAEVPDDATGEDAYARRLRMSGLSAPLPPPPENAPEELPPPPAANAPDAPPPPPPGDAPAGTISRAPVRYDVPRPAPGEPTEAELERMAEDAAAEEAAQDETDAPRSKTPGQKGFAQRIMEKYGWQKGKGLGANETGIITPLAMKAEKRKKLPDAKGGGWAGPGGMGKITGGKKAKGSEEDDGKHGKMSKVVVMSNMLVGMDVEKELEEGTLMQEIGEELENAGGRLERIFINRYDTANDVPVFAHFTNELSALRAVNAMDGRVFNGNAIRARYYDEDKFVKGDYTDVQAEAKE